MAHQDAVNLLRVVTQRLSSTPSQQLPHVAAYLATNIAQFGKTLATINKESKAVEDPESAVIIHKLKTQLSALLQDKNPEARYAAVILIKATVEVGGWNILQGLAAWVRFLIGILGVSVQCASCGPGLSCSRLKGCVMGTSLTMYSDM